MARIFAIVSTKGGVGKTTLTANFGGILADMGQRVLLIDADHQQSLTNYYKLDSISSSGLRQLITTANATGCISTTQIAGLDIVLSDDPNKSLNDWLRQSSSHYQYLLAALSNLEGYDYVIIDTKGTDGTGELQEMAIRASDQLISPITPEWVSTKEFMRNTVTMLQRLEPPPGIPGGLPIPPMMGLIYGLDRTSDTAQVAQNLRKAFYDQSAGKISILNTVVPSVAAYNQAAGQQVPVHRHETKRYGSSKTLSAHDTMLSLVHELLPHLSDITPAIKATRSSKEASNG
ncbi:MAG: ParA family protein [Gammaproteobacteria bacterium]